MQTFGDKLLELVKSSVITQSLVTLALVITMCVLWAIGKTVPSELYSVTMIVVGFWFGSKTGYIQGQASRERGK